MLFEAPHRSQTARQQAARCAAFAHAAYPDNQSTRRQLFNALQADGWGCETIFTGDGLNAIVVYKHETLIVAVAGTQSVADAHVNASVESLPLGKWCEVAGYQAGDARDVQLHSGFLGRADALHSRLQSLFSGIGVEWQDFTSVFLTGHSLGAATATIAAILDQRFRAKVTRVVTFGGPRVVATQGRPLHMPELYAIERLYDLVPMLPMRGYQHPTGGTRVILDGNDAAMPRRTVAMRLKRAAYYAWQARKLFNVKSLGKLPKAISNAASPHYMPHYIRAVQGWR